MREAESSAHAIQAAVEMNQCVVESVVLGTAIAEISIGGNLSTVRRAGLLNEVFGMTVQPARSSGSMCIATAARQIAGDGVANREGSVRAQPVSRRHAASAHGASSVATCRLFVPSREVCEAEVFV